MNPPSLYVVVSTHTTRHLARVLVGLAHQRRPADTLVVSTDNDSREIADVVIQHAKGPALLVQRPAADQGRSGQTRNNGVRALLTRGGDPHAIVVFLDGDCVPAPDLLSVYQHLCGRRRLALGFRIDLTQSQTDAFDDAALAEGREPVQPTAEQLELLRRRTARAKRQALLRRSGLGKPHKPKLLSANFAACLSDLVAVNGFDEEYQGYGQEDDDLGRRLYRAGCRPVIAISTARVYHLYHPTRAPQDWHASPNAARFLADGPTRCVFGLDRPLPQERVITTPIRPAATASTP